MNQKFFEMPKEKQLNILNAAMDVFAKYEYKNATTDEMVKRAGISKGLLFHYFENKKGLYLYLYQYAEDLLVKELGKEIDWSETDFFQMLEDAQMGKLRIMKKHPSLFEFITKAYFEKSQYVEVEMKKNFQELIAASMDAIAKRTDCSKFQEGIDVHEVLNIIIWMSDGFLRSRSYGAYMNLEKENQQFLHYMNLLKSRFYKEEWL